MKITFIREDNSEVICSCEYVVLGADGRDLYAVTYTVIGTKLNENRNIIARCYKNHGEDKEGWHLVNRESFLYEKDPVREIVITNDGGGYGVNPYSNTQFELGYGVGYNAGYDACNAR